MEILDNAKIIFGYLKEYKKSVIKTAILNMVLSGILASVPYIYGRIIDMINSQPDVSSMVFYLLGIWTLMSFFSALIRRIASLKAGFISIDVLSDFTCSQINHIINLPLSFHREKKIGEIVSRINRSGESLRWIIDEVVFWILPQFFTVFVGIFIIFLVDWRLSAGALIIFISSAFITIYKTPAVLLAEKKLNRKFDEGLGILNDSLLNIQSIKSFASENYESKKIEKSYKNSIGAAFKKVFTNWDNTVLIQEIFFSMGFVAVFGYAIILMGKGQISNGTLVMFLGYLNIIQNPLRMLLWSWLHFQRNMVSIKRARKIFSIKTENYNKKGLILGKVKGKVEFRNVSFKYPGKELVLDKINFTVLPGQKIAIVGGSGEGKTTLVDLLSLYFLPTKGSIFIDDINVKKMNLQFLREIIAYVPQEIILFNDTIKNNILYGKSGAKESEIIEAAKSANIHDFIMSLFDKYETLVGERGIKLSTGQKQRIAIARAVLDNPDILVLDEATSSLDSELEKLIQNALEKLITNRTTFIVAHRLSTVRKADKILVLSKGKIVEQGKHQELIKKKGAYYKFYSLQFKSSD